MFHLLQTFPTPPSDITQFFGWITAPETLFALFLIYLKLPFVINWPDWQKGAVAVVGGSALSGVCIGISMVLTPELLGKIQPFYGPFVIILNLVLGYYGIQAIRKPLGAWWGTFIDGRRARIEEKRATVAAINRAGNKG